MSDFTYKDFKFDREQLRPGWVHLGWGNFARSFIGDITNQIANKGYTGFGLVVVVPTDRQEVDIKKLAQQDNIYHLIQCNGHETCRRIGSVRDAIIGARDNLRVIDTLGHHETQLVTLTIKGGYCLNKDGVTYDWAHMNGDIEALRKKNWAAVKTVPGWIMAGLHQRFEKDQSPFMVMSCDNLERNGQITTNLLRGIASLLGNSHFSAYVNDHVVSPNTVVDRITPPQDYTKQSHYIGQKRDAQNRQIVDHCAVVSEGHRELIVENVTRMPEPIVTVLKAAKTVFTDNIIHFEDRKLHLLNGSHMLMGVVGMVLRVHTVRECMYDPVVRPLVDAFLHQAKEAYASEPGSLDNYRDSLIARFENPNKHAPDTVDRLIRDTTGKIGPRFLMTAALEKGLDSSASAFAIASWLRFLHGRDASGNGYNLNEKDVNTLANFGKEPSQFRANLNQFLGGLAPTVKPEVMADFTDRVVRDLQLISSEGLEAAIQKRFPAPPNSAAHAAPSVPAVPLAVATGHRLSRRDSQP